MSYDLGLYYKDERGNEKVAEVEPHTEGGTYVVGGSVLAGLSITYNYAFFFYTFLDHEDGLRWLYGKTGKETVERLRDAVEVLGTTQYKDYWAPTPGNAGHALNILLGWAEQHPDAVWHGD